MTSREANADLLAEITALRNRLASLTRELADVQGAFTQATQREATTSEILRVISSSPTAVLHSGGFLCPCNANPASFLFMVYGPTAHASANLSRLSRMKDL